MWWNDDIITVSYTHLDVYKRQTVNPVQLSNKPKGTYSVVITNIDGCSSTQSVEVLSTLCTIPNGISPNGDGFNDSFDLSGFTGIREIKIFNRYGMVVYEQENYIDQWHGQQKNSCLLYTSRCV